MIRKLPSFPDYEICDQKLTVRKTETGKIVILQSSGNLKLKDKSGKWKNVRLSTIKADAGITLQIPKDSVPIPGSDGKYYIDKERSVTGACCN